MTSWLSSTPGGYCFFLHSSLLRLWPHKWKRLSCFHSIFCTVSTATVLSCLLPSMDYSLHADILSLGHLSLLLPFSIHFSIFNTDFPFFFLFAYVERWGRGRRREISHREGKMSLKIISDGGGGRGNWMKVVKRYKLAVIRWSTRGIMYNMVNIINTAVRYIWKLLNSKS